VELLIVKLREGEPDAELLRGSGLGARPLCEECAGKDLREARPALNAQHGTALAAAGLAVRKQRTIVAVKRTPQQLLADVPEEFLLWGGQGPLAVRPVAEV